MKLNPAKLFAACAALLGLAFLPAIHAAAPTQSGATKISVTYQDWKKFTDIKDSFSPTDSGELAILKELETALQRDAKSYVPDGDHLTMVFTNIDLAGDYQPGRGPNSENIRIVKDIYPPRLVFTYTLTNSSGVVIKSGKEQLGDMNFQSNISFDREEPLHYEKDELKNWMDRTIHAR